VPDSTSQQNVTIVGLIPNQYVASEVKIPNQNAKLSVHVSPKSVQTQMVVIFYLLSKQNYKITRMQFPK